MTRKKILDPLYIIPKYLSGIPCSKIGRTIECDEGTVRRRLKEWNVFGLYNPKYKWKGNRKEYHKIYDRERYLKNKEEIDLRNKRYREKTLRKVREYKKDRGCKYCNEGDPCCLDFHHLDPEEKEFEISTMIKKGFSWKRILKEINKCDIICSNCHRKYHCSSVD